jgi:hypothetical protein
MKPLIIRPDGRIRCMVGFPEWKQARHAVAVFAELTDYRPDKLKNGMSWVEFRVSKETIWQALELGWSQTKIISTLRKFSQQVSKKNKDDIRKYAKQFGRLEIVKNGTDNGQKLAAIKIVDKSLSIKELLDYLESASLSNYIIEQYHDRLVIKLISRIKLKRAFRKIELPVRDFTGGSKIGYTIWTKTRATRLIWLSKVFYGKANPENLLKISGSFQGIINRLFSTSKSYQSWVQAINYADLDPDDEKQQEKWSEDKLLNELKTIKEGESRIDPPYLREKHEKFFASLTSGVSFSGKGKNARWKMAVKKIGLDPKKEYQPKFREDWSQEKICAQLQEIKKKDGKLNRKHIQDNYTDLDDAMCNGRYYAGKNETECYELAITDAGFEADKERLVKPGTKWSRARIKQRVKYYKDRKMPIFQGALSSYDSRLYEAITKRSFFDGSNAGERWTSMIISLGLDPAKESFAAWMQRIVAKALRVIKHNCGQVNVWHLDKHHPKVWRKLLSYFPGENSKVKYEEALKLAGIDSKEEYGGKRRDALCNLQHFKTKKK